MQKFFALLAGSAFLLAAGCNNGAAPPAEPPAKTEAGKHVHEHQGHGAGPHDGTLADWGGGAYHVEFVVDHDKKEATVYILGGDEKTPAPVKTESITLVINDPMTEMELKAQPLEGEAAGMASRFVGTHDTIGIVKEFAGTISGVVEGTPYNGDFKEEPHDADHGHDR